MSGAEGGSRRSRVIPVVAVVVGVVLAMLVYLLASSPTDSADPTVSSPLVGKLAPVIDAKDTAGKSFRLDDYRGAWLLVNFFATWCGPCKAEHPQLEAFANEHESDRSAYVVSVSFNDEPAAVEAFFQANGGDWPVIAEGDAQIALDYGVIRLPESYLIAPSGRVVQKFSGGIQASDVDQLIASLSSTNGSGSASTTTVPTTAAVGSK